MNVTAGLRSFAAASATCMMVAATVAVPAGPVDAAPDIRPVYARAGYSVADPGVVRTGNWDYYAFTTGGRTRVARAPKPAGRWASKGQALTQWPRWATGTGAVWAPDTWHTSAGWVLYFAARAKNLAGQRCIGAAVSDGPAGPYEPKDTPLICTKHGAADPVQGRPNRTSGVIDPSPFQAKNGSRYLLYKTQKTPATLRMFPLSANGLHGRGKDSRELLQRAGSIEHPDMVQRGDRFVLFASANWWDQCKYSTVWLRSKSKWAFKNKKQHVLLNRKKTGLCGPGGADVVPRPGGRDRMFIHGWVCSKGNKPCQFDGVVDHPDRRRVMYATVLGWGKDGATPHVRRFLSPAG